jgi:predicted DNA-binding transcriptional regulator AlpA
MQKKGVRQRHAGTALIWPAGVEEMLGVSPATRWRMERERRLPPRDGYVGGKAVGWRPETIEAMLAGEPPTRGAA